MKLPDNLDEKKLLMTKEAQLRDEKKLLITGTAQLRDEKKQLREELLNEPRFKIQRTDDFAAPKKFNPADYHFEFPFFAPNGESYLNLVDRDTIVRRINYIAQDRRPCKYRPIVISTSRGMAKTFLFKMIALQNVAADLKCPLFDVARKYGRI